MPEQPTPLTELDITRCEPGVCLVRTSHATNYQFVLTTQSLPTVTRHPGPHSGGMIGNEQPDRLAQVTAINRDRRREPGMIRVGADMYVDAEHFWWRTSLVVSIERVADAPPCRISP